MHRRLCLSLAAFAVALAALGCGAADASVTPDGNGNLPPVEIRAAMSQLFAELSSPALTGPSAYGMAVTSPSITDVTGCVYTASAQRFVCPDITIGGLKLTKSFVLSDGSGAAQHEFSPTTTGAIRIESTLAGPLSPDGRLVTDATQQLELGGLRTGTHVVNGTSHAVVTGITDPQSGQPVTHTFVTSIHDVVLPTGSSASGPPVWPPSGVISAQDSASMQGAAPSISSFDVRFSGTSKVSVVIMQGATTQFCTMDLAATPLLCR